MMKQTLIDPNDPRATPQERALLRSIADNINARSERPLPRLPKEYERELDRVFAPTDGDC